jgi:hypothetical protein
MYSDEKCIRKNRLRTDLNDYEHQAWLTFCASLKLQPATILREIVLEKLHKQQPERAQVIQMRRRYDSIRHTLTD